VSTVLIPGASGFIGRQLARVLDDGGADVVAVTRTGEPLAHTSATIAAGLGESIAEDLKPHSIDAVVHAANDDSPDAYRTNVEGTRRWFDESQAAGAQLQILLSSLSARPDADADYGRAKYALEQNFVAENEVAFRLGVVVGNGGMFERMVRSISGPVVPLLDGGAPRVHVLGIRFLCEVLRDTIDDNGQDRRGRVWNLQQPSPFTLREMLTTIRAVYDLRCRFVPVPSLPVLWALKGLELLPLSLPVSTTNVRGLRQSRSDEFPSDFAEFGGEPSSLESLVREAHDAA